MADRRNRPIAVDRLAGLNDPAEIFKNPQQLLFIRSLVEVIRGIVTDAVVKDEASPHLHLTSSGGKVYKITALDDGTLEVLHVQG